MHLFADERFEYLGADEKKRFCRVRIYGNEDRLLRVRQASGPDVLSWSGQRVVILTEAPDAAGTILPVADCLATQIFYDRALMRFPTPTAVSNLQLPLDNVVWIRHSNSGTSSRSGRDGEGGAAEVWERLVFQQLVWEDGTPWGESGSGRHEYRQPEASALGRLEVESLIGQLWLSGED